MGQSGIGSVDVLALSDPNNSVAAVIRVFNDAGAAGTSGFTESGGDFLDQNKSGIVIYPPDPSLQRFNVRSFSTERPSEWSRIEISVSRSRRLSAFLRSSRSRI
jgi:hypothetical protein